MLPLRLEVYTRKYTSTSKAFCVRISFPFFLCHHTSTIAIYHNGRCVLDQFVTLVVEEGFRGHSTATFTKIIASHFTDNSPTLCFRTFRTRFSTLCADMFKTAFTSLRGLTCATRLTRQLLSSFFFRLAFELILFSCFAHVSFTSSFGSVSTYRALRAINVFLVLLSVLLVLCVLSTTTGKSITFSCNLLNKNKIETCKLCFWANFHSKKA